MEAERLEVNFEALDEVGGHIHEASEEVLFKMYDISLLVLMIDYTSGEQRCLGYLVI